MCVLGIETSGTLCGAAVADADGVRSETSLRQHMDLSGRLLPAVERALEEAGVALPALAGISVSLGPGSFTGLRIGVTTAKTLAWAAGIPLVGVPTLAALAAAVSPGPGWLVRPLMALGGGAFAIGGYWDEGGWPVEAEPVVLWTPGGEPPREVGPGPCLFVPYVGDDAGEVLSTIVRAGDIVIRRAAASPSPGVVARLGWRQVAAGNRDDPFSLAPLYLRVSTPEARLARLTIHA